MARSSSLDADAQPLPRTPTVVEVFADVVCPFTHVGLRRFVGERRRLGRDDVRIRVRSWPLEIVNGSPLPAELVAEEAAELRGQVAPDAFAGFRPDRFPSTSVPALALAAAAYDRDLGLGEAISLQLRDLLFERGVDISQRDVLGRIAADHGLEPDLELDESRVLDDLAEGRRRGVIGSPHFFTPAGDFFCPSLEIERDEGGALHISPEPAGFDRFLEACFPRRERAGQRS